jgi:hypothetical protein
MNNLGTGVNASVCPSGGNGLYGRIEEFRKCGLEMVLHAASGRLMLPATEWRAVILDAKGNSHGSRKEIGGGNPPIK